ncbi:DUF3302 domain-containing protein [Agaribacterium sp. ZY112]|uniref:DUF3302 domain-containing protein n=1 Tax=Agaribacterium sp. ZY112 TaxID=3233574 RepID=UPI003524112E
MLDYFALGLLIFVFITLFYGVIVIHDIPYEIAKKRNHPQQDAIHVAGWVSLFTLHVLWPFLWIWATLYREDRGWGFTDGAQGGSGIEAQLKQAQEQISSLNERLQDIEQQAQQGGQG